MPTLTEALRTVFLGRLFPPADPTQSFSGKTVLVTGANTGLGFVEAAAKIVHLNAAKVILACRDLSKAEAAKQRIVEKYGGKERIEIWKLDMNDYDSVQACAARATELERLDAAILNAGVVQMKYKTSRYGWEEILQVNVLSTAMLGLLLLPKLKAAKAKGLNAVLEIVGSALYENIDQKKLAAHQKTPNVLEAYNAPENFDPQGQYNNSKFLLMHVYMELLALLKKDNSPPLIIMGEPGPCTTDLSRNVESFFLRSIVLPIVGTFFRTPEQGSRSLVSATLLGAEAHGKVWQHDKIKPLGKILTSNEGQELQHRVWKEIAVGLRKDWVGVDEAIEKARC